MANIHCIKELKKINFRETNDTIKMGYRAKLWILNEGILNGLEASKFFSRSLGINKIQIKTSIRFHLTAVRMAKIINAGDNRWCGGSRLKRNTPPLLGGFQAGKTILEINLVVPLKIGHSSTWGYSYPGIHQKDSSIYNKHTCSTMFIAVLFIIHKAEKNPEIPQQSNGYRKYGIFSP